MISIRISRGSAIKGLNPMLSLSVVVVVIDGCKLLDGEFADDGVDVVAVFFLRSFVEVDGISMSSLIIS